MKRNRNKILITILVITIILLILCVIYVMYQMNTQHKEQDDYSKLASSVAPSIAEEVTSPSIDETLADNPIIDNPIDFESLQAQNDEIYSWIYIPDTNINYPVCRSNTNDNFYLDHDIYGNYSFSGSIYSQYCNSIYMHDRVTVLYGHNMADGSMFADLYKFTNTDFFNDHEYFYIYRPQHKLTYRIVSVYSYEDRHIMNSFDFDDDKVFQEYLDYIQNPRSFTKVVRDNSELTINDKIVTLSTCLNSGDGRLLLQGVLIKDELTK